MKYLKTILLISFFSNTIFAQDTIKLEFRDAIEIGLEKNISIKQQDNLIKVTKSLKTQSIGSYLPNVYVQAFANNSKGYQFNNQIGAMGNYTVNKIGYGIYANYTLFSGFSRLNSLNQSESQYKAQLNMTEQTRQNIIFTITNQYLQILLDQELIKILTENIAVQKILLEQIKGYVDVNIKAIQEQYAQQAQVNLAEVQLLTLNNQLFSDKATLSTTLMLEEKKIFTLSIPDWDIEKSLLVDYPLDTLLETAKNKRADLQQLNENNTSSEYGIKIARSALYPNLQLSYNYVTTFDDSNKENDQVVSFGKQLSNPAQYVGLTLTIPIFNQFVSHYNIVNAKITHDNNLLQYQQYEKVVYSQVQTAYNNFIMVKESYKASLSSYDAAKLSFEKYLERYHLGIGNIVEFSQANQAYIQAQSGKAQAEFNLLFQKIMLDYYTGSLDVNNLFYK